MFELDRLEITQEGFSLTADWSVAKGQKIAIIGPSGGGKTTLLSAIAGFVAPACGDILLDGVSMSKLAPGKRPVSLLFQSHNLFPHLSVFQNVGLGLRADLKLSPPQQDAVHVALAEVGLKEKAAQKPANLSGGQAQRAALARVLLRKKPLLLLDEPFAALGPALKVEMLDLVDKIVARTGSTLLMVTHDPADAKRITDLTVLVDGGVAQRPVATDALFANPPAALSRYLGT
ncbi:MAG: ATP-binding cassette domain-containing protein [Alphaproteobacteria bacterium]|nr:ATP-binding cassette domain-containing protein [Alphaproteobacteria bacterium]